MTAQFFYEDRAGIPFAGGFITAEQAKALLEHYDATGSLEGGFEYCTRGGEDGALRLVPTRVTPVDASRVPPDVLEALAWLTEER